MPEHQLTKNVQFNKACVFGNPIAQSKSPLIHEEFAKQCGIQLDYQKREPQLGSFNTEALRFFEDRFAIGANVTMPFKQDALKWVDTLSKQAKRASAVNTIIRTNDGFVGENTDGYGLVMDLRQNDIELDGASVLLIGAGGAAQGVLPALIDAQIKRVSIYNRTEQTAKELVNYTNSYAPERAQLYTSEQQHFDLVINASPLSLSGRMPDIQEHVYTPKTAVYDMVYQSQGTVFTKFAQQKGCLKAIDGLGMLVGQAARSFECWFDTMPDVKSVLTMLKTS